MARHTGVRWSRQRRAAWYAILLCARLATVSSAQPTQASAVVRGVVVDSLSGRPLLRATVAIGQTEQTTDYLGQFAIRAVPPGAQPVRIRRLGYVEYTGTALIGSADTPFQRFALIAVPAPLTEVTIEGKVVRVPRVFEAPYQRAARGGGHFFTKDDIDLMNPMDVGSLLNLVPGVSANDRGVTFQRCQQGLPSSALTLGQGLSSSSGASLGSSTGNGKVQLWIDGYRVTGRSMAGNLLDLLATVPPSAIEIIEIYSGVSRIPADFLDDACAVIVIWTKRY